MGRFANRIYNRLVDVKQHLVNEEIVSDDSKMAVWLSVVIFDCMLAQLYGLNDG